ncbi:GNAT family N-acetyltransferase [Paenibacillus sp. OAS669]|uniref:GNAT family N-acetyltransferase n=1 Tax=Paenibacillus sp. OAS669 TaxID=2663821 RepID=UPI00178B97C9|nr:GNAT family N-acetyltransferase [Paenibacillus sp. OAS669]MBE1446798.1 GNAT superfamily N-acetyltransferase [Paenibacillus sp. OAS669]
MNEVIIHKAEQLDGSELTRLVEESTGEGFRHLQRLIRDYESGTNTFDKQGEALFLAYYQGALAGVCGLNQDPYALDQPVGRVRRMYVSTGSRRLGIGRRLMEAVIAEARCHYSMLVLRTDNPEADRFYRSLGFKPDETADHNSHYLPLEACGLG